MTVTNETLARRYFGGEDPLGRRVYFGGFGPGGPPEWHEVIGIVGDVRHRTLDVEPDVRVLVVSAAALLVATFCACLVPARRAVRINPVEALRTE